MDLDEYEVGYFIQQVGLAAASFGVASADIQGVATALNALFGYKCAPAVTVIPAQGPQFESICVADSCPLAANATCSSYNSTMTPAIITGAAVGSGSSSNSTSGTFPNGTSSSGSGSNATSSAKPAMATANGAGGMVVESMMGMAGIAAAALFAL